MKLFKRTLIATVGFVCLGSSASRAQTVTSRVEPMNVTCLGGNLP
jgi:hypothetical protein